LSAVVNIDSQLFERIGFLGTSPYTTYTYDLTNCTNASKIFRNIKLYVGDGLTDSSSTEIINYEFNNTGTNTPVYLINCNNVINASNAFEGCKASLIRNPFPNGCIIDRFLNNEYIQTFVHNDTDLIVGGVDVNNKSTRVFAGCSNLTVLQNSLGNQLPIHFVAKQRTGPTSG
jgi:hypothetical protein